MVLLPIISLFIVTIAFCDLSLNGPPVLLLGYLFLKYCSIAQCLSFFGLCCTERCIVVFQSFALFIFTQLLPRSVCWKTTKVALLTTYHRRISANTSKQGKKATVSTTRCVFQWHAMQTGLAINHLEADGNIEGNSLSRNKTINGISSWIHLGILFHVIFFLTALLHSHSCCPSSYCETFCSGVH